MIFFRFRNRKMVPPDDQERENELVEQIELARKEWDLAKCQLDQMSEPELVDYAIYRLQAAERRYMYLLKKADENGICRPLSHSLEQRRTMKG